MKASNLIKLLEDVIAKHGDVLVFTQGGEYGEDQDYIKKLNVEQEHFSNPVRLCVVLK